MSRKKETQLSVLKQIRDLLIEARGPIDKRPLEVSGAQRFIKLPDDWVKDSQTGLEWGPSSSERMPWEKAKTHCEKIGGRLPTVKELHSIVDYEKRDPAINVEFFPNTQSSWYWSSTLVAGYSGLAWIVGFYGGYVGDNGKDVGDYVRPVRASQ